MHSYGNIPTVLFYCDSWASKRLSLTPRQDRSLGFFLRRSAEMRQQFQELTASILQDCFTLRGLLMSILYKCSNIGPCLGTNFLLKRSDKSKVEICTEKSILCDIRRCSRERKFFLGLQPTDSRSSPQRVSQEMHALWRKIGPNVFVIYCSGLYAQEDK